MSSTIDINENCYIDRTEYIINSLAVGADRKALAHELGYTNPKSLDIFMRRKGFVFDRKTSNYKHLKSTEIDGSKSYSTAMNVRNIISLFSREGADPKQIAALLGFQNHMELAEYMKNNNYAWNDEYSNYIHAEAAETNTPEAVQTDIQDINELLIYVPLLRELYKNRSELINLLDSQKNSIRNSIVTSNITTNSVKIDLPNKLIDEINKYCHCNKISMDKIFELAIIDFLSK